MRQKENINFKYLSFPEVFSSRTTWNENLLYNQRYGEAEPVVFIIALFAFFFLPSHSLITCEAKTTELQSKRKTVSRRRVFRYRQKPERHRRTKRKMCVKRIIDFYIAGNDSAALCEHPKRHQREHRMRGNLLILNGSAARLPFPSIPLRDGNQRCKISTCTSLFMETAISFICLRHPAACKAL